MRRVWRVGDKVVFYDRRHKILAHGRVLRLTAKMSEIESDQPFKRTHMVTDDRVSLDAAVLQRHLENVVANLQGGYNLRDGDDPVLQAVELLDRLNPDWRKET